MSKNNSDKRIKKQASTLIALRHKQNAWFKADSDVSKKAVPVMAIIIFAGLFITSAWMLYTYSKYSVDAIVVQDVEKLQKVFKEIDKDCSIIDFAHTKNYIDFLTVKEFVGSQIGSMNVAFPHKWKGPYLTVTPTVSEQQYIILKTQHGFYIVPGDGVVLANGKTIGKDIIFDAKTDVDALLQDQESLKSSHGALAAKIEVGRKSYIKSELKKPLNYLNFD